MHVSLALRGAGAQVIAQLTDAGLSPPSTTPGS
jgi:hypothetical protein